MALPFAQKVAWGLGMTAESLGVAAMARLQAFGAQSPGLAAMSNAKTKHRGRVGVRMVAPQRCPFSIPQTFRSVVPYFSSYYGENPMTREPWTHQTWGRQSNFQVKF